MPSGAVICDLELWEAVDTFSPAECALSLSAHSDAAVQELAAGVAALPELPMDKVVDRHNKVATLWYAKSEEPDGREVYLGQGRSIVLGAAGRIIKLEFFME